MIELLVEGDHERTRYALPTTQNTLGKGGRVQQTHEKCRAELLEEQSKGKRTPAANLAAGGSFYCWLSSSRRAHAACAAAHSALQRSKCTATAVARAPTLPP